MDLIKDTRRFRCVGSVHVPAIPRFEAGSVCVPANRIMRLSEDFVREMGSKVEDRVPEAVLTGYELLRSLRDSSTVDTVPGTLFLAHFLYLLCLPVSEVKLLRTDGMNAAYVFGAHGYRCGVSAEWKGTSGNQGWHLHAVSHYARVSGQETENPWSGPHEWPLGTRFVT